MNRLKMLITIIMLAFSLVLSAVVIWSLIFGIYYFAFLILIALLISLPVRVSVRRYWLIRLAVFVVGLVLVATTIHYSIGEVNSRIDALANKPRSQSSLSEFSTRDKISIYGLNIIMGTLAYPLYPEVAKETLMMVFPPPEDGVRTFNSDFAINSREITDFIREFNDSLNDRTGDSYQTAKRITWSASEYQLGRREARYAMALNPSIVSLSATRKDSIWVIDVSIKVDVKYPQRSNVVLVPNPELRLEEGLYWVLQQTGWLFPYIAEWTFSIDSNDSRINQ